MPTLIASLLRKAALLVLMLLALSLAVFYISRLTPGDPLQSYYGDAVQSMSSAELDALLDMGQAGVAHLIEIQNQVTGFRS